MRYIGIVLVSVTQEVQHDQLLAVNFFDVLTAHVKVVTSQAQAWRRWKKEIPRKADVTRMVTIRSNPLRPIADNLIGNILSEHTSPGSPTHGCEESGSPEFVECSGEVN